MSACRHGKQLEQTNTSALDNMIHPSLHKTTLHETRSRKATCIKTKTNSLRREARVLNNDFESLTQQLRLHMHNCVLNKQHTYTIMFCHNVLLASARIIDAPQTVSFLRMATVRVEILSPQQ